jgi:CDP-diglyceride synthetase
MNPLVVLQLSILLMLANGTPVIAKKVVGGHYSYPLDGNLTFADGRPVFGRSKTIRGVALAVLVTTASASLIGLGWRIGLLVGSFAMAGDLFSSFCKRRLGLPSSSRASGLDQIPESLLPLLACRDRFTGVDGCRDCPCVVMFVAGEVVLSRLLYAFRLRDRPY